MENNFEKTIKEYQVPIVVSDDASEVLENPGGIDFGTSLDVVDNGDDTVTVNATGTYPAGSFTPGSALFAAADGSITEDNSNLFWDDTNNRLGVGTATPASALHLNCFGARTDGLTLGNGSIGFYSSNGFNNLLFFAQDTDVMVMDSSSLRSTTGGSFRLRANIAATATSPNILPDQSDLDTGLGQAADDQLSLIAGGVEGIRIVETGGVAKTVVNPDGAVGTGTGLWFGDGDTGIYESSAGRISFSIDGNTDWEVGGTLFGSIKSGRPALRDAFGSAANPNIHPDWGDQDTGIGHAANDQLSLIAGGVEGMRIVETGGVAKTVVNPDGAVGTGTGLWFGDGDTGFYELSDDRFRLDVGGSYKFEVQGNYITGTNEGRPAIGIRLASSATTASYTFALDEDTGIGRAADDQLSLIAGGVEGMRIVETGGVTQVGLGTTTPNSTLHVEGSVSHAYRATSTLTTLDETDYQLECTANTFTVTLPTAVGITGRTYSIKNTGSGTITIDGDGTETIDGQLTQPISQWDNIKIMSNGSNWIII